MKLAHRQIDDQTCPIIYKYVHINCFISHKLHILYFYSMGII